jgi:hypothetical protein
MILHLLGLTCLLLQIRVKVVGLWKLSNYIRILSVSCCLLIVHQREDIQFIDVREAWEAELSRLPYFKVWNVFSMPLNSKKWTVGQFNCLLLCYNTNMRSNQMPSAAGNSVMDPLSSEYWRVVCILEIPGYEEFVWIPNVWSLHASWFFSFKSTREYLFCWHVNSYTRCPVLRNGRIPLDLSWTARERRWCCVTMEYEACRCQMWEE